MRVIDCLKKAYRLRRGPAVRLHTNDGPKHNPVVGTVIDPASIPGEYLLAWDKHGYVVGAAPEMEHPDDLIEVLPERTGYMLIFDDGTVGAPVEAVETLYRDGMSGLVGRPLVIMRLVVRPDAQPGQVDPVAVELRHIPTEIRQQWGLKP